MHLLWNCLILLTRIFVLILIWSSVSANFSKPICPPAPSNCIFDDENDYYEMDNLLYFTINGIYLKVKFTQNETVEYSCGETILTINDKSLPVFERTVSFAKVTFDDCGVPAGSYAKVLATLNITGFNHLSLSFTTCDNDITFTKDQFTGLEDLQILKIVCRDSMEPINYTFLEPLKNLKRLIFDGMLLPPLPEKNRIRVLEFSNIQPLIPVQPWGGCEELEELIITRWKLDSLPEGWLAKCSRLTLLQIKNTKLDRLPMQMISSDSLRILQINKCGLKDLSQDLLVHVKNLRVLDLSHNNIQTIDRSIFSSVTALDELHLSNNKRLENNILVELTSLKHLRSLSIDNTGYYYFENCNYTTDDGNGKTKTVTIYEYMIISEWPLLPSLERLVLSGECLCEEWKTSMPSLIFIKFNNSFPFHLSYHDVQLIRSNGWEVDLRDWTIDAIDFTKNDYELALNDKNTNYRNATIWIKTTRNCNWYWFAKLLKMQPNYVLLPDLKCTQHGQELVISVPFEQMPLENFSCKINDCERGCVCYWRSYDNTTQVNCSGAELDHLPRVPFMRKIYMANNHIKTFNFSDFNEPLEYIDLRYNQLTMVNTETASAMFNRLSVTYHLEGNPISCSCNNSAFIDLLQRHQTQVMDYKNLTCNNGQPIEDVNTYAQCLKEYVLGVLGILLGFVAVLFLIFLYLYYRYQNQIQIILYAWGWCHCWVNEEELDRDKAYDVFISFANEDCVYVMNELVPGLEKEPDGFTVCVHYRDWMPGEWIPTQIAQSVEQSRRTIIVLSKNFLSSIWALLEFRTAHTQALKDGRIRLIIILLDDVIDNEKMDDELRAYLSTNTYIKRGDPRFWDKLRYTLPHRECDEGRLRAAGDAVVRRLRPSDQFAALNI